MHSGRVSDLGTALVGGAIGSAITIVAGQFARARVAWSEITVHDSLAAEANEQLFVWVDDRTRGLVTEMRDLTEQFNARGAFHSSLHAQAMAEARARALHEYRDQEWRARMRLFELAAAEGGWHLAWRTLRGRSAPALTATDTVEPFPQRCASRYAGMSRGPTLARLCSTARGEQPRKRSASCPGCR
jgi:hypothetical protein